jgi:glycosyltransferase involved in cell wall biosynthesis
VNILFLDHTGKIAGAELVLLDIARHYRQHSHVLLFEDGPFSPLLQSQNISVSVASQTPILFRRDSNFLDALKTLTSLAQPLRQTLQLSQNHTLLYANTLKAFVIGAAACLLSRRPLIFHLHDILSAEHFSPINQKVIIWLSNHIAKKVITVSQAAKTAFIEAGGRSDLIEVVYNGFDPTCYQVLPETALALRQQLNLPDHAFVIGSFSRLSPWKGQHILLQALAQCPDHVIALLVGDSLFGEESYAEQLKAQVKNLNLQNRVHFLGFRSDVPNLMAACHLLVHTATAPEPAGRVLVEALLAGKPLIATQGGGTDELVERDVTGYLIPPGDPQALARSIQYCIDNPQATQHIAQSARAIATERFSLEAMYSQIDRILTEVLQS